MGKKKIMEMFQTTAENGGSRMWSCKAITNAVYALNGQFVDPMLFADFAVKNITGS